MRLKNQCKKLVCWIKKRSKMKRKTAFSVFLISALLLLLLMIAALAISAAMRDRADELLRLPDELASVDKPFDCILVLGCGLTSDGKPSPMLADRLETAIELYHTGVSDTILLSGDHRTDGYNEVGAMYQFTLERGIPERAILLDSAGLSTYDSVARMIEVYGVQSAVIVTQEYHLYRAVYIAEKLGIDAYGVSATRRPYSNQAFRDVREVFARCKDVYCALRKPPYAT